MKKYIFLIFVIFMSTSLSAQVKMGVWKGKDTKNWFTIIVSSHTKAGATCEIETKGMKARGKFSKDGKTLTFSNGKGELALHQLSSERSFKNAKGYLQFVATGGTVSYKVVSGNLALPGWDEGVAAVVINHEER